MCRLRRQYPTGAPARTRVTFVSAKVTKAILPRGLRPPTDFVVGNLGASVASMGPSTAHP